LTDAPSNLRKWQFPGTNLPPAGFLVVFASEKDRRVPGAPLHTNFRLAAGGEFLALVEPNGTTIASQFAPIYPPQAADASYGFGFEVSNFNLLTTNAPVRVLIPSDGTLNATWTQPGFNDSAWQAGTGAVGFDTEVGDPVEDFYTAAVSAAGPIGWWRLEEASGTSAVNLGSLGAVVNATYQGSPTLAQAGPRPPTLNGFESGNLAPRLNGTSARLQVPDNAAFDFGTGPYSVALWFNPVNAAIRGDLFTYKASGNDYGIHLASSGANTISVYHNTFIGTGGSVANNQWHFLVVTRNSSGLTTAYLNGAVILSGNDGTSMSVPNDLVFGANHTGVPSTPSILFNGLLDEPALYNRALTADEINAQYQAALRGNLSFTPFVGLDVRSAMHGVRSSAYLRWSFEVSDVSAINRLRLRLRYDDGVAVYVNGQEVLSRNAPSPANWDAAATARHPDVAAIAFEEFNLDDARDALRVGANVLAIQGLNIAADNADFLVQAELTATTLGNLGSAARYFSQPTPGEINGVGTADLGPIITHVQFTPTLPNRPRDNEDIVVTARVAPAFSAVTNIVLRYRVMYGATNDRPMMDDGLSGDGAAGDGVFGAVIPASASTPGQMVRFNVRATDALGRTSRWPLFEDPLGSAEYLGTVVADPSINSTLPVMEWFSANPTEATTSRSGARASFFFNGEFFDNVFSRVRGSATTTGQKLDLNRGQHVLMNATVGRVEEVNLNGQGSDPTLLRPPLAFETFRLLGNAASHSFHVLLRRNAAADRVAIYVEQPDDEFLQARGLDSEGALYKFDQRSNLNPIFSDATDGVQKRTRRFEDNSDLQALVNGLNLPDQTQRIAHVFDHLNIPNLINFVAVRALNMDSDDARKNIYMYRDTRGNREWSILPWDKDWTYGIEGDGGTFLHHPFFADQAHAKQNANQYSVLWTVLFNDPPTREMYLRRLRTLMDEYLQPPGTPAADAWFERRVDAWHASVSNALPGIAPSVATLKNWFPTRRTDLFVNYAVTNVARPATDRLIPGRQLANVGVALASIEVNPSSGVQDQEYICLTNGLPTAVDISGWSLAGAVEHVFAPGTVVRSNNVIYVSPNVNAFRARATGPRGGLGLFVQGNYRGQLSARGEEIRLLDPFGNVRQSLNYPGTPSDAQQYLRITEIMYHPSALAGNPASAEEFEFIELRNISPTVTLNLAGVRLINGVEFAFTGSAVTSLAPGARVVVVRNLAAFTARYGAGPNVAGQFSGALENRGERLQLVDATGEEILDFSYNNSWYPMTDGQGFSLVAVNEGAPPESWGDRTQWRASGTNTGTPSNADPGTPAIPAVRINEVLSRSDEPPPTDSIELFNPAAGEADISGWFLTDDFNTPRKFRIPDGTVLAGQAYRVFTEADFNPGGLGFALSSDGDEVWLFSANSSGQLTGYSHGFAFGAADDGITFGRHVISTGEEKFVAQSNPSLEGPNFGPSVGPIVITEIMYRPKDHSDGTDNDLDEFIELQNIFNNPIDLFDAARPTNTWRLTGGVDFDFPGGRTLLAGERLLLVNFNPTNAAQLSAFRTKYSVPAGVAVLGPYRGRLNNDGDDVELKKPTTPLPAGVPYVLVDKVDYGDAAPWPPGADGTGLSLQRRTNASFGNDPANWVALAPSAGVANSAVGIPPTIVSQPQSQIAVAYSTVVLSVSATGDAPLSYQWRRNGDLVTGATNAMLVLANIQPQQNGGYDCVVANAAGSVVSSNAVISLVYGAAIIEQPISVSLRGSTNVADYGSTTNRSATFTAAATSSSPITYQWRFNGGPIAGATGTSYTVTNVTLAQDGLYDVVVTDAIGSVPSTPARLAVLLNPIIALPPVNQTVVAGGDVTFSVAITGNPAPFRYEWRRGSIVVASNYASASRIDVVTLNTIAAGFILQPGMASSNFQGRIVITNAAQISPAVSTTFTVTVVADGDGDGLADAWELAYFGSSTAGEREVDSDGDGALNWQEQIAGTDPTNPASVLRLTGAAQGDGPLRLSFDAIAARAYSIQSSEELRPGTWSTVLQFPARTTNWSPFLFDPAPSPQRRFYRIGSP
jgi:hypothetical protein